MGAFLCRKCVLKLLITLFKMLYQPSPLFFQVARIPSYSHYKCNNHQTQHNFAATCMLGERKETDNFKLESSNCGIHSSFLALLTAYIWFV